MVPRDVFIGLQVSRSGELAGQSCTVIPWSANQWRVFFAIWAGAKSCWRRKSACPYRIEMLSSFSNRTSNCFADNSIAMLDWPANSPDLNPIENLRGAVKRTYYGLVVTHRKTHFYLRDYPNKFKSTTHRSQACFLYFALLLAPCSQL